MVLSYLGSLITEDGECTTEFRTRLNRGQAIGAITAENMEKSQHIDFNEDTTNESASVARRKYKLNILKNTKTNLALTKHKFKNNSYLRAYCCAQLSYITQNGAVLIIFPLYLHTDNDHRSDAVSGRRGEEFTPVADPGGVQGVQTPALLFRCPF